MGSIEVEGIESSKVDALRIKSIASLVKNSTLAVPVKMDEQNIEAVWNAAKGAKSVRLQVEAAVSPSCMEYIQRKKADVAYLAKIIEAVVNAGAKTVTVCDAAGSMLPEEFAEFISNLTQAAPQLNDITLGISCCNNLNMADACAVAGVMAGASLVKATSYPMDVVALDNISRILAAKADALDAQCHVRVTELKRAMNQIARLCCEDRSKALKFTDSVSEAVEGLVLTAGDDQETVMQYVERLGYSLSDEDAASVFEAFKKIAANKENVGATELDAIVASAALQVPPTYVLEGYVINTGMSFKATSHISLRKNGEIHEAVSLGDGPIDSSFKSIESVVGKHYELDDFHIQAVTEGREAVGESIVKLIADGKVYSGRGISTDIVESSIRAYINALNKIAYEEQN